MDAETSVSDPGQAHADSNGIDTQTNTSGARPPAPPTEQSRQAVVIEPSSRWRALDLREVWAYRELLQIMVWRDVTVRYKQTVLGMAWAVVQPFFTMVVFTVIFGRIARISSEGIPYPVFSFTALVAWTLFSTGISKGSNSLVGSSYLLKKVYMPRLILPLTSVISPLVDFAIAFVFLLGLATYFSFTVDTFAFSPGAGFLFLPAFVLLAIATSLGASLWLSAMNVQFRDVQHAIPFLTQLWMYATPVAYPTSEIQDKVGHAAATLQYLNPMTAVVNGFRWSILGLDTLPGIYELLLSCYVALVMVFTGALVFRRMERTFADVV